MGEQERVLSPVLPPGLTNGGEVFRALFGREGLVGSVVGWVGGGVDESRG